MTSYCGGGHANQHLWQTPHLCCHSQRTFVWPSPWSFSGTLSCGVPVCWLAIPACIPGSSLAFVLPLPGSPALLLSSSDRRWSSVWFLRQSLTLLGSAEKRLLLPSFPPHILRQKVCTFLFFCCTGAMAIINVILTDRKRAQHVKRRRRKTSLGIYLEPAVVYQNIHLHPAFKGDPAVNWNPAIIWQFTVLKCYHWDEWKVAFKKKTTFHYIVVFTSQGLCSQFCDDELFSDIQITDVVPSCFLQLRNIAKIENAVVIHGFIYSCLDYCEF